MTLLTRRWKIMQDSNQWLSGKAVDTILTSFGTVDGTKVIAATNEYLNNFPMSKNITPRELANLINNDPMMVCSLGLDVVISIGKIPWRCAVGGGGGYFNTGIIPNSHTSFLLAIKMPSSTGSYEEIIGERTNGQSEDAIVIRTNNSTLQYQSGTYTTSIMQFSNNSLHILEWFVRFFVVDNVLRYTQNSLFFNGNATRPMYLFWQNNDAHGKFRGGVNRLEVYGDEGRTGWFVPYVENGVVGLMNLETGNYANKVGTFTEKFYLSDGTEWVPLS